MTRQSIFPKILLLVLALLPSLATARSPQAERVREEFGKPEQDIPLEELERKAGILLRDADQALVEGDSSRARAIYETIVDEFEETSQAPEAHLGLARYYARSNQFKKASFHYQSILRRYPAYPRFTPVIQQLFHLGQRIVDGERPYYWGVIPGFRDSDIGIEALEGLVKYAPYSDLAPKALLNIAILAQNDSESEEAIHALDRLINRHPGSSVTPEAYLMLGRIYANFVNGPYYDQEATRESIKFYRDFLLLFPDDPRVTEANSELGEITATFVRSKFELGEFYWYYRNLPEAALLYLNDAITADPRSPVADEARALIARIESGERPPKTPYDYVFGRYVHPESKRLKPIDQNTQPTTSGTN